MQSEKVVRPELLEQQARRSGITRVEVAQALQTSFEGRAVGFYREPGSAGAGMYPQEARLLPIVARPPENERSDVGLINNLQIWSPVAGRMIPISQVTSGTEVVWEDPVVSVQANQQAVGLARMRYLEGSSSYVEVLDALQRLYPAQLSLAQTEINRRLVIIQLYKALGGGWNQTDAQFMTAK